MEVGDSQVTVVKVRHGTVGNSALPIQSPSRPSVMPFMNFDSGIMSSNVAVTQQIAITHRRSGLLSVDVRDWESTKFAHILF